MTRARRSDFDEDDQWGLRERIGCALLAAGAQVMPAKHATPKPPVRWEISPDEVATCAQLVVVSSPRFGTNRATVSTFERFAGRWVRVLGPVAGWLGPKGFTTRPSELDWFTPVGLYPITHVFGHLPDPGCAFDYLLCGGSEFWVDDVDSPLYNTLQRGAAEDRWQSAEQLADYPHAFAFAFNQDPVVPDGNSAIFFHEGTHPTAGCVAVEQDVLVEILRWLDPARVPLIALGVGLSDPDDVVPAVGGGPGDSPSPGS